MPRLIDIGAGQSQNHGMKLISLSETKRSLNFLPNRASPIVTYSWKAERINNFDLYGKENEPNAMTNVGLELSDSLSLAEAFLKIYSNFKVGEMARLARHFSKMRELDPQFIIKDFIFNGLNARPSDRLHDLVVNLSLRPDEFLFWIDEKSVGAGDLQILLSFLPTSAEEMHTSAEEVNSRAVNVNTSAEEINTLCLWVAKANPTKSEGVEILELGGELLEMGAPLSDLSPASNSSEWIKSLWAKRYPESKQADETEKSQWQSLSWPRHTKTAFLRKGDTFGAEVKFFARSRAELKTFATSLLNMLEKSP